MIQQNYTERSTRNKNVDTFTAPSILIHVISRWTNAGEWSWCVHTHVLTKEVWETALIQIYERLVKKTNALHTTNAHSLTHILNLSLKALNCSWSRLALFLSSLLLLLLPLQVAPSEASSKPSSQVHMNEPYVFKQPCEHGFVSHSSTSGEAGRGRRMSRFSVNYQTTE